MDGKRWVRIGVEVQDTHGKWSILNILEGAYDVALPAAKQSAEGWCKHVGVNFHYQEETRLVDETLLPWAILLVDDPTVRLAFRDSQFLNAQPQDFMSLIDAYEKGNLSRVQTVLEALSERRRTAKQEAEQRIADYIASEKKPSFAAVLS